MYQYPDYLMHYGVLGMKWGRRRERRAAKKEAYAKSGQQLTKDLGVANKAYKEAVKRKK